ncbi:interleukin 21 receptor, tandem duplicate 1 [Megalops cyprinoides]|uniref:interleukin 21 receptor, tandem duplicate 1 n=1 Tax=Megalops cyprinoides TaxID=118141 RepID=UPI001863B32C|nr:interleukin 21 receptor, tandem duplicate 1 [Megalops cyprinoides]
MAAIDGVKQVAIVVFAFCVMIQHTTCFCNVTCSTDFISSLNCSCSDPGPASSYIVEAECWDDYELVKGSCEIQPPQQWCQMEPENFTFIVAFDTYCTARAKNINEQNMASNDSTNLTLYNHIRPLPPFNMQVVEAEDSYNISWEMSYTETENIHLSSILMYRVRIRTQDPLVDPVYQNINEDRWYLVIPYNSLQEGREYMADVQATVNPSKFQSYWSEWSPVIKWKTKRQGFRAYIPYVLLLLGAVAFGVLYFCKRRGWLKKMHMWRYVPSPEDFFKPLYQTYEGDFKKWVGPTFAYSEFDFLEKSMVVQVVNERQVEGLEKQCEGHREDSGSGDSSSCVSPPTHGVPKHSILGGLVHSEGHISIDTVTVSGEDSNGSGSSQDPYRGSRDGPDFPGYPGDSLGSVWQGDIALDEGNEGDQTISGGFEAGRAEMETSEDLPIQPGSYRMEWQLVAGDNELEQISLDSFCSTERSEDGYPRVGLDLDTIDSGFLESDCSSPVGSDFDGREQMHSAVLGGAGISHTNYVKQWVAYTSEPGAKADTKS